MNREHRDAIQSAVEQEPLLMNIHSLVRATNRVLPVSEKTIRAELRSGVGVNVERRRLGHTHLYAREEAAIFIAALIDKVSKASFTGPDPEARARRMAVLAKQRAQREAEKDQMAKALINDLAGPA